MERAEDAIGIANPDVTNTVTDNVTHNTTNAKHGFFIESSK